MLRRYLGSGYGMSADELSFIQVSESGESEPRGLLTTLFSVEARVCREPAIQAYNEQLVLRRMDTTNGQRMHLYHWSDILLRSLGLLGLIVYAVIGWRSCYKIWQSTCRENQRY